MKNTIIGIFFILISMSTMANIIQIDTAQKPFKTFASILSRDVNAAEKKLRLFMKESLGCSTTNLDLNILRDEGLFNDGIFILSLTANCDSFISDVQLDFDVSCTTGDTTLLLQYSKSGQKSSKKIVIDDSESCQE